jgi:Ser/Thr protein kinase RdoA (MazF antagonist)
MEQEIKNRFNDAILHEARQRYHIAPDAIRLLDSFESLIFEFERDGRPYILRLGHSRRRTPDLVRGEADWLNYLAAGGAGVAPAVLSAAGELVELIDDGRDGKFLATAFVRAPGRSMWQDGGGWSEPLIENYGRLMGRIHALTKDYRPANPAWQRLHWYEPANRVDHWLPSSQAAIHERYRAVRDYLQTLPQDRDSYGLIHQDAHTGNFFVADDGRLTLFDFDDCVYGHFAYDLAMVLFYAVDDASDVAKTAAFIPHFWQHFMRGYRQENYLDPAHLLQIPHFLLLREIELYMIVHRDFEDPTDSSSVDNNWLATFVNGRRGRIEQGIPYLNTSDFSWLST